MLFDLYQFVHNSLNLHFWDLPALLVAIVIVIVAIVHSRNQKKRENEYEEKREEKLKDLRGESPADTI